MEDAQPNDGGDKKIVHVYPLVKVYIQFCNFICDFTEKSIFKDFCSNG